MAVDTVANSLLTSLIAGVNFTIPTVDLSGAEFQYPDDGTGSLYQQVTKLDISELTDGVVGGSGAFEAIVASMKAHLREEYDAGRITGDQYAKVYISIMETALSQATSFVLNREQTYWNAITGQLAALTARHDLEIKKIEVARVGLEARTVEVNYAKTKISLATEGVNYDTAAYNLSDILPKQAANLTQEGLLITAQVTNAGKEGTLLDTRNTLITNEAAQVVRKTTMMDAEEAGITAQTSLVGKQEALMDVQILHESDKRTVTQKSALVLDEDILLKAAQTLQTSAQTSLIGAQESKVNQEILNLGEQLKVTTEQILLTKEQTETQRSQTMDTRTDGITTITGSVGKQKDLYTQQITSYQRDSEIKAAKIFSDAWITQKTIDEGLTAPNVFTNASVDGVFAVVRTNNGLD